MKKLWVASMVLASSSTYAASFNCQQASTPVEHMICDTPRLSSLDETLNDTYSTALTGSPENASGLKAVQRQWITMRNKLTTVKQLELAYGIQISGLKSLSSVTSDASETPTSKPVTNMDTKKASESSPADEVPATHNQSKQQISNLTLESFKKSFIQDREGEYHSTTSMPEGSNFLVLCASRMANDIVSKWKKEAENTGQMELFFEVKNRIHTATTNGIYEKLIKNPKTTGVCDLINAMP